MRSNASGDAGNLGDSALLVLRRKKPRADGSFQARLPTPFALVGIRTEGDVLAEIMFLPVSMGALPPLNRLAERACVQIEKYADDPDFNFRLPLKTVGTDFQRRVWAAISAVPKGQTLTYGRMARGLGSAARAVGQACGSNFFPLVIPCHRVTAVSGLGGFAHSGGGYLIEVKRRLLAHEGVMAGGAVGGSGNLF
jgi:methylated-DNA-[protein]-cysteine S-methyltransferase